MRATKPKAVREPFAIGPPTVPLIITLLDMMASRDP
jgi:hypothetical protein